MRVRTPEYRAAMSKRKADRRAAGQCYDCDAPAVEGRTRCAEHLRSSSAASSKWTASPAGKASREARADTIRASDRAQKRDLRRGGGRFKYVVDMVRRRGKTWTLTEDQWLELIAEPCIYCGLPNDVEAGAGLDRLDNSRGYEPDNVVSCCVDCNLVRGNRFTPEEMRVIGATLAEVKAARL